MTEPTWNPLNRLLYYLCLAPSSEGRQRKHRRLREAAGTRRTREKAYRGREKVEMRDRQVVEGHTHGRGGWVHGGRHGVKGVGGGQRKCQIFRPCQAGQVVGEDVHVIMMKY